MRTAITGGAGFIGSHLTEHLLNAGDEVVVLDNLSTGRLSNLDGVLDNPGSAIQSGRHPRSCGGRHAVDGADRVFHLAAAVGVHLIVDKPLESLRTNIHGTEVVLMRPRSVDIGPLSSGLSTIR